jgi:hypothetical protein
MTDMEFHLYSSPPAGSKAISMKKKNLLGVLGLAVLSAVPVWSQRPFYLVPGMHPSYTLTSMKPVVSENVMPSTAPNTGAMTWLADGRLFIASMSPNQAGGPNANRLGPSNGYIFSGIPTATSNATVTVTAAGSNYQMPSGAVALGDTIYVLDNDSGLTKLTPGAGGTYTKSVVYSGVLGYMTGKSGLGYRTWAGGLAYKDGYFYATVGMALNSGPSIMDDAVIYRGKGTVLKIKKDGSTIDTMAGGVRNPVSLDWGPEGELFYTDNQGSFMPASALFHVKQGRFFGHLKTPFDNQMRTPPAIIFPYGSSPTGGTATNPNVTHVATGWVVFRDGPFRGQMLFGSNNTTGTNRVFLEKVGGEYQGALFPFSQGFGVGEGTSASVQPALPGVLPDFRTNVNRLSYGPDGRIYVGGGGSTSNTTGTGAHGFVGQQLGGLARMSLKSDTTHFEMKAVRSLSATELEIEFTEPITAAAVSNFTVRQGVSVQATTESYGAGYGAPSTNLTVSAVALDASKKKVTLTVSGLQQRPAATTPGSVQDRTWGSLIQINVTGVTAVSNRPMWGDGTGGGVAWYTLNKFGPGVDVGAPTTLLGGKGVELGARLKVRREPEGLRVIAPSEGAYTVRLSDLRGRTLGSYKVRGGDFVVPASALGASLSLLEVRTADGERRTAAVPKF